MEKTESTTQTKTTELLAPVPAASDYSVSADLWQRLEEEIQIVSQRIENGEELMPEDVANVRKLKSQVDSYATSFNKAMRDAQGKYRGMLDRRLTELGYDTIEQFVAKKKQEQSNIQNARIAYKMGTLKNLSDGLLERTERLKDTPMAKELLPAFTARFPKIQSGAKNNDINDWKPYFAVMSHAVSVMDTFFRDPKYEDAILLPIYSGTIRELLAYAKDGSEEHLANVKVKYQEDQYLIRTEKLKQSMKTKAEGVEHIQKILEDMGDLSSLSEAVKTMRMEQAWEEISLIVRLINNP